MKILIIPLRLSRPDTLANYFNLWLLCRNIDEHIVQTEFRWDMTRRSSKQTDQKKRRKRKKYKFIAIFKFQLRNKLTPM